MPADERPTIEPQDLITLIRGGLDGAAYRDDAEVAALLRAIRARHRGVRAVLLYGSYLRGRRDTLLDFYVLVERLEEALPGFWQRLGGRWLPPNVYYLSLADAGTGLHGSAGPRCKYALMSMVQFERALATGFHSYFWSRFTQPCVLVHGTDGATAERIARAIGAAVHRFTAEVAPLPDVPFSSATLWRTGLGLTYACELRAEPPERVEALYLDNRAYFDALTTACARAPTAPIRALPEGGYGPAVAIERFRAERARAERGRAVRRWARRRALGKLLSVLRLVKAVGTFEDPLDYLLWKIERHSGVYLAPSPRQRRYPLIFAWGLLWRLYRRGAFR